MKILIISQHIFPMQTPRAHRTTELMKEFARQGHEVTVYAVLGKYDYSSFEKETGIKVKPIPIRWMWHPYSSDQDKKRTLVDKVLVRLFQKSFEFPEIEFRYRIPEILKKDHAYDVLISIAAPHHIHWGVAHYKEQNPENFPKKWIADCGDPFMMNNRVANHQPRFEKQERLFCELADYISIPVESAKGAYYPEYQNKMVVIPQGFKFEDLRPEAPVKNPLPTFAFAGTFYNDIRNPSALLNYLASLTIDFRFVVYTAHHGLINEFKNVLGDKLVIKEVLPREELLKELASMDFLINIENADSPHQVPSKLIDYALTGRPILSVNSTVLDEKMIQEFFSKNYSNQFKLQNLDYYHITSVVNSFMKLI
jgi:hypothetical protein